MKLVDANVLIYAVDSTAQHHAASKRWLDAALNGSETILLPWVSTLAFIRITTNPRLLAAPLTSQQALEVVHAWLQRPNVVAPEPDAQHTRRLAELLAAVGIGGNLVNDAHLAALALQWGATVVTFDSDFGRFPSVSWESPQPAE
ncbi:hypothetical protein ATK17_2361 [Branchiibius hedensis]|uniref:Ribonuclease VapC n=1 Tax=Branchiibius hedensis TaxID=672460 RepID=A0A2Y8ZYP5_9MICO|nr:TA system VapC family ribonuclease toxin [Branchiibius hedensis]PWJ26215.1 hypothetical protein ATK17_2361 [Branchiibius hedensis]SSA35027.1 toxin-antitoxin system PIN domain toxin [Branchiibius hedensis]